MIEIVDAVASAHRLSREALIGKSRNMRLVRPRWMAMRLLRDRGEKLEVIGALLGNRDHATVFWGLRRAADLMREDEDFRSTLRRLKKEIAA
jgi:chromosomal replication initiator protein